MTRPQIASLQNLLEDRHVVPASQLSLIRKVASFASEYGLPIYLVGGFVRDLRMGRPTLDHDYVLEGDAIPFARALAKTHGGRVVVHPAFHTATWHLPEALVPANGQVAFLDLASARNETYAHPAALPTVTLGSLADDLRRRDFTINAMAVRLDGDHFGECSDPFGGQRDLKNELIRVLHPHSFIDDPTRIFRAARYAERYGFKIESETLDSIPAALKHVDELSGERLRHELDLILEEEHSAAMLARLADLGLLAGVRPALPAFEPQFSKWLGHLPPAEFNLESDRQTIGYLLWLMNTPEKNLTALADRLAFTSHLTKTLSEASRLLRDLPALDGSLPSRWTVRLDAVPPVSVYAVYLATRQHALKDYLLTWRFIKPTITGDDLKARGLTPGPAYKRILETLRAAWLDGEVKTKKEETHLLETLL